MQILHMPTPLPRTFEGHPAVKGLVFEGIIRVTPTSRLLAKVLVFRSKKALARFWTHGLKKAGLGPDCYGAVTSLGYTETNGSRERLRVDPRYFCVMGFVQRYLGMEILAHESVHAGYCWCLRRAKSPWVKMARDFPEEELAYPVGRIARELNRLFHDHCLYIEK